MALAERFTVQAKGGSNQGMTCSVAVLLTSLPVDEAVTLRQALDAPWRIMGHQKIEDALREEGHYVGTGAIGKHRRGNCRCSKSLT